MRGLQGRRSTKIFAPMGTLGRMGQEPPRGLKLLLGVLLCVLLSAGQPCTAQGAGAEPQPRKAAPELAAFMQRLSGRPRLVEQMKAQAARRRRLFRRSGAHNAGDGNRYFEGVSHPPRERACDETCHASNSGNLCRARVAAWDGALAACIRFSAPIQPTYSIVLYSENDQTEIEQTENEQTENEQTDSCRVALWSSRHSYATCGKASQEFPDGY